MNLDTWFVIYYWLVLGNVCIGLPLLLVMSLLLPPAVKAKYLRQPYYSYKELRWLARYPLAVFNNVALASMFVWPRLGRKRGVIPAGDELPGSYTAMLRVYFWGTTVSLLAALSIAAALHFKVLGP